MPKSMPNNQVIIRERREKLFVLLTKGMRTSEIAKELKVDHCTVSRDIQFLTQESQNFLSDLAKQSLPFFYQTSIEGIRAILQECWKIYSSDSTVEGNEGLNWTHRLAALKLAKECHQAYFECLNSGPSIMHVQMLEDKLAQIEESAAAAQKTQYNNQIISIDR
jgi:hypothetical protein